MPLKAVFFDLDGTLIDSVPLHKKSFQVLFKKFGHPLSDAAIADYIRWPTEDIYDRLKAKKKLGLSIEKFIQLRREIYWHIVDHKKIIIPKQLALAKKLKANGYKIALATNSSLQTTLHTTPRPVLDLFDCIATFSDVLHGKPAPDLLQFACRKLNVKPFESVMIGDSVVDVKAGHAARVPVIAFSHKHAASTLSELKKTRPYALCKTPGQIEKKIMELAAR